MNAVKPYAYIVDGPTYEEALSKIERAGRICYQSENRITSTSAQTFIASIIERGHESILEHGNITVRMICDRGVSHELVRHRIGAYSQESTRYCNYSKQKFGREITCVIPSHLIGKEEMPEYNDWRGMMETAEAHYMRLLDNYWTPQQARAVLPHSLKTEIYVTYNIREWRHFFKLRTAKAAHPDMRYIATMLLKEFKEKYPVFFNDIEVDNFNG